MFRPRSLLLAALVTAVLQGQVVLRQGGGKVEIEMDGKSFSTFYYGPETPKPYLHPLRAADGTIVTRGYPMEQVAGETRDHPHHRGLWFTHGDVNGYDFWANEPGQHPETAGRIVAKQVQRTKSGEIRAVFEWRAPDGSVLLSEDRTMAFDGDAHSRVIELDIKLTAVGQRVKFGDTKEGTFAIRLATPLDEPHEGAQGVPRTGKIVSANGQTREKQVWGTRSPWVDYSGVIEGKPLGIAIFDHPGNPKHPAYWHVRGYGLFAANIFGEHDFHGDPSRDGSVTVAPGESLRFRYQVVIHEGDTEAAGIADLYHQYAQPAPASTRQ